MAVWCLGEVGETAVVQGRTDLLADKGVVHLYENRMVTETTVGALARRVLETVAEAV
jgi:hypothetical protein